MSKEISEKKRELGFPPNGHVAMLEMMRANRTDKQIREAEERDEEALASLGRGTSPSR